VDGYYSPASDRTLKWDDPDLMVFFPEIPEILSEKDQNGKPLAELIHEL
jgi:dTDP-4-dehydrorhamnose 3,5-epimerase-like enzyme